MPNTQDPRTVVKTTDRLWSEEVALAEADNPLPAKDIAYQFSDGVKFEQPADPYA
jgi:hypothetical protein